MAPLWCFRLIPFIGYHHVVMVLILIAISFLSILLAGCTSTSLYNVYLLSISYINASSTPVKVDPVQINPDISNTFSAIAGNGNNTVVEVRAGYMGMCIRQSVGLWVCSNRNLALANMIKHEDPGSGAADPLNLIWIAGSFRNQIIFDGLIYAAIPLGVIAILLLSTFPGWHEEADAEGSEREVKPFPSRPVSQAVLVALAIASVFLFVSILWQHVSSSAAATMVHGLAYGTAKGHVGSVAMVLGWGGVFLFLFATIAILVMILSIRVLSENVAND